MSLGLFSPPSSPRGGEGFTPRERDQLAFPCVYIWTLRMPVFKQLRIDLINRTSTLYNSILARRVQTALSPPANTYLHSTVVHRPTTFFWQSFGILVIWRCVGYWCYVVSVTLLAVGGYWCQVTTAAGSRRVVVGHCSCWWHQVTVVARSCPAGRP